MLWEHMPQASVSTALSSSPKLSRAFLLLERNTENIFSISCIIRKHRDKKRKTANLFPRSLVDKAEGEIWQSKKICFS